MLRRVIIVGNRRFHGLAHLGPGWNNSLLLILDATNNNVVLPRKLILPGLINRPVIVIAAIDRNRVIGRGGGMPWHLPADLRRFKQTTLGTSVIMGRKTYESIGRPLSGRQNIVISRQSDFAANGCELASSLDLALRLAQRPELMVIGGGEIYRLALPIADRLLITEVDTCINGGQVRFPKIEPHVWLEINRAHRAADCDNRFDLEFVEYQRR